MTSRRLIVAVLLVAAAIPLAPAYADPAPGNGAINGHGNALAASLGAVYNQPPSTSGGLLQSSKNGTDADQYVWDNFKLAAAGPITITDIAWVGAFDPTKGGSGGPVVDFTVAIYPNSVANQPDIIAGPLVSYLTGGNAGETPAGTINGVSVYTYQFTLPTSFKPAPNTGYWVQIEASQTGTPDWCLAVGTGGDNYHYLGLAMGGDISYYSRQQDVAFKLLTPLPPRLWMPLVMRH